MGDKSDIRNALIVEKQGQKKERQRRCIEIIPKNPDSIHIGTSFQGKCMAVKQEKAYSKRAKEVRGG